MYYKLQEHEYKLKLTDIQIRFSKSVPETIISKSFHRYLNVMKEQINSNINRWSYVKIFTNPYEYIHTHYDEKLHLSKLHTVSRSFYKLIELSEIENISACIKSNCKSMHIAEGPGGFIQAMIYLKQNIDANHHDIYNNIVGITLNSHSGIVPNWNKLKSHLPKHHNIVFDNLKDNTGNLYNAKNLEYAYDKYKNSMNLITADGGFDFSTNYELQEHNMVKLLLVQSFYAILCQKKKGTFIIKLFDIFIRGTIDVIYLLNMFYENVYVCKPVTSRPANSEKYLICKNFRYHNTFMYLKKFKSVLEQCEHHKDLFIQQILNVPIHDIFINKLEEFNIIFGQQQIENINTTLILMENELSHDTIESYRRNNIQLCIQWFQKHNIPVHIVKKMNIFNRKLLVDYSYEHLSQ